MRAGDEAFDALRAAIDDLADAEAPGLVAEARIEARAKVRSILAEAMAHALLERSHAELGRSRAGSSETVPADEAPRRGDSPDPSAVAQPVSSEEPEPSRDPAAGELGWYVYGVIGGAAVEVPDTLLGVDGRHPVRILPEGHVGAVASQVPLSEFGEETLRESLNDVEWLERTARGHERVLDEIRGLATVIPMRLCTVYRSRSSVADMLRRERAALAEALDRLDGKTEWGLKIFADPAAVRRAATEASDDAGGLDAELADASAGAAYMRRRQLEDLVRAEADRVIDECVEDAHSRLAALSVEALSNPLQPSEATGHSGQMVLNGVYLVDDAATDEFHAAVVALSEAYAPAGFEIEPTGPWPPYNFVKSSIEAAW